MPQTSTTLVAVDIGNSRIKLGRFERAARSHELPEPTATLELPLTNQGRRFRFAAAAAWCGEHLTGDADWLVSSVHRGATERLIAAAAGYRPHLGPQLAAAANRLRRRAARGRGRRTGARRHGSADGGGGGRSVASARIGRRSWSTWARRSKSVCCPDVGAFVGGAILPGMAMSARALEEQTDALPHVAVDHWHEPPPPLGKSTVPAIESGIFWGAVGAIRELVSQFSKSLADAAGCVHHRRRIATRGRSARRGREPRACVTCRTWCSPAWRSSTRLESSRCRRRPRIDARDRADAAGRAAVAVVLVAGPGGGADRRRVFPASRRPAAGRVAGRIEFSLGRWGTPSGEELVVCRRSDETVEIHCHGGVAAVRAVIDATRASCGCEPMLWQDWLREISRRSDSRGRSDRPRGSTDGADGRHSLGSVSRRTRERDSRDARRRDGERLANGRGDARRRARSPRRRAASHVAVARRAGRAAQRRQEQPHQCAGRFPAGDRLRSARHDARRGHRRHRDRRLADPAGRHGRSPRAARRNRVGWR